MMNLQEIINAAQGGNGINTLATQFGIAPDQAQQAVSALLPAISMGLQQQAQSIDGWRNILLTLGQAQGSATLFDADGDGIPDHVQNEGRNALGALFGGQAVTDAVAQHAAQFAGLPASLMQQMMPAIAAMVVGGLTRGAMKNGLGGLFSPMMQGGAAQGAGFGGLLGSLMGGGQMGGQPAAPQRNAGGLGGLLGGLMAGMQPVQQAPEPASADPVSAGLDLLKGMFQTGQDVHAAQLDGLQQIFQRFTQKA